MERCILYIYIDREQLLFITFIVDLFVYIYMYVSIYIYTCNDTFNIYL